MNAARPRKHFGQHFLHDRNIIDKMIASIAPAGDQHFVEIGPGRGALTLPLLAKVGRLDVIEIDRALAAGLQARSADPRLIVHQADALKFDLASLDPAPGRLRLVGNLPYNISSPLLFHFLAQAAWLMDLHVMLQREVVDRMAASPGSRKYGRLTVALAARCPPKVDSTFVRLTPDPALRARIHDETLFDRLVSQAFSMRRKRIANALRGAASADDLTSQGVDPGSRAENVSPATYVQLANFLAQRGSA
jgi:16S rRNA (adenine1518-N6/adenine1519-N6)-dimethyltransferase